MLKDRKLSIDPTRYNELIDRIERRMSRTPTKSRASNSVLSVNEKSGQLDRSGSQTISNYPRDINVQEQPPSATLALIMPVVMERVNSMIAALKKDFQISLECAVRSIRSEQSHLLKQEKSDIKQIKSLVEELVEEHKKMKSSLKEVSRPVEAKRSLQESFNFESSSKKPDRGPRLKRQDIDLNLNYDSSKKYRFDDKDLNTTGNFEDRENIFSTLDRNERTGSTGLSYQGSKRISIPRDLCQTDYDRPKNYTGHAYRKPSVRY